MQGEQLISKIFDDVNIEFFISLVLDLQGTQTQVGKKGATGESKDPYQTIFRKAPCKKSLGYFLHLFSSRVHRGHMVRML